jgi:hypothetical protein
MEYRNPLNAGLVLPFQRPRCAAVNQIRDVTMAHLLIPQD